MAGSLSLAMSQQLDANGSPLAGALLWFFEVGTVATLQDSFVDFGLTIKNPNPLQADQSGRIPNFYLDDGQVHVRLTDASGVVIIDIPSLQVLGPSSGGGSGGGVDPTAIASPGDFKWRPTSETLTGWVKANNQTIGSATSGATQRANADTQALFTWLWNNTTNAHCPVSGGRGASGLADFAVNKTIQLPDMRSRSPFGVDDMGNTAANRILAANITSGGGDGPTSPAATGGEANHTLLLAEAPTGQFSLNDPGHHHSLNFQGGLSVGASAQATNGGSPPVGVTGDATTGITLTDNAGGQAHNNMPPAMLGTWYIKL